jgi:hypothetical protein
MDPLPWTIENATTHETFEAIITRLVPGKRAAIGKPNFKFDWKAELQQEERQVFKLTTPHNPAIIHGLLSLSPEQGCVKMHLIESARFNQGSGKQYIRVAGNLIACACRLSFNWHSEGYVFFQAKTGLVDHYQRSYGAKPVRPGQPLMMIDSEAAKRLLDTYYHGY